jgi:hypothetical protein
VWLGDLFVARNQRRHGIGRRAGCCRASSCCRTGLRSSRFGTRTRQRRGTLVLRTFEGGCLRRNRVWRFSS